MSILHHLLRLNARELTLQALFEALFHQQRIAIHEVFVEAPHSTCLFQAASLTANLFLERVVEECVGVVKGLVAALAGECRPVMNCMGVQSYVRGNENALIFGKSRMRGYRYACVAMKAYLSLVASAACFQLFSPESAGTLLFQALPKLICKRAEVDFEARGWEDRCKCW